MTVEFFNFGYFLYLTLAVLSFVGLYLLLRFKEERTQKTVLALLLFANLVLHFIKPFFTGYNNSVKGVVEIFFTTYSAVSVLLFPFVFLSKNKTLRDYMFYMGVAGGLGALAIPTEALGQPLFSFMSWRFYFAHSLLVIVPMLMVVLKLHTLDYRRIWRQPIIVMGVVMFIIANQVIHSELGIGIYRNADFLHPNYTNPSLVWGPYGVDFAGLFDIVTPDFLKRVPYGEYKGESKYWPGLWLAPTAAVYFTVGPFVFCLPWEYRHFAADVARLWQSIKPIFYKTEKI